MVWLLLHGYVRITEDLDLVLDLSPESLSCALSTLAQLGYRPLVPVKLLDFANPALRIDWIETRNMKVFNLVSDRFPDVTIDIFPKEPFAFDAEFARCESKDIAPNIQARVVSLSTLIALKAEAGRPRDLDDIDKLQKLHPEP